MQQHILVCTLGMGVNLGCGAGVGVGYRENKKCKRGKGGNSRGRHWGILAVDGKLLLDGYLLLPP